MRSSARFDAFEEPRPGLGPVAHEVERQAGSTAAITTAMPPRSESASAIVLSDSRAERLDELRPACRRSPLVLVVRRWSPGDGLGRPCRPAESDERCDGQDDDRDHREGRAERRRRAPPARDSSRGVRGPWRAARASPQGRSPRTSGRTTIGTWTAAAMTTAEERDRLPAAASSTDRADRARSGRSGSAPTRSSLGSTPRIEIDRTRRSRARRRRPGSRRTARRCRPGRHRPAGR